VQLLARRQLTEEAPLFPEYHARLPDPSIIQATQPELHPNKDFWEADIDHSYFVCALIMVLAALTVLSFLILQIGKYSRKTEENIDVLN
jgi:hypothetical protein